VDLWLDWSAFGFLALLTLLDGLRRVPAGAFVLRRVLGGTWQIVPIRQGYGMVSWWPPLTTTMILGPPSGRTVGPLDSRTATPRGTLLLNVLGFQSLVALVVVVPIAIRWWGGLGFLASLAAVLLLSWVIAGLSFYFSRALGLTTRQRLLFALPRLNPFAAPAAGEAMLERSWERANPFAVARDLMKEDDFIRWIRPMAYDTTHGNEPEQAEALLQVLGKKELKSMVESPPAGAEARTRWCPRCGSEFGAVTTECPACEFPLRE
jgi:hypothetical protein